MFDLSKCATAAATALLLNSVGYSVTAVAENNTYYTLEQAVNYALDNNPSLQVMHERIAQAEAQLGEARASFYPQVKARLSYEHSDNPARAFSMIISQRRLDFGGTDFNHPGGVDNYHPEVIATYSLFNGGQDYQNKIAAELGVDAATLEESATRNQLIQSVTSAFYGVLAAKEAHKVAQRSIDAVKSELEQSRTRFEAGTVLKSDVLSLEVQLAEAQDAEIRAANAIELAQSGLKTLMGINAGDPFAIAEASSWQLPQLDKPFATLLAQAIAQRPEAEAAQKQVEIAERKLSAAKGAHLPKADAYLSYGSDSKNLDYSTSRDNVTAGVQVEVDVFSGFRTSENVKKAERQLAEAQKIARKIQLDIENDVKTAYLKLQEALDRVKVTTVSVASAEEAFRLVSEQRQADVVTITRYIESEVARDEANSRVIAARYDALQAEAELNKALGNWK
ncbi:TolC family protein [Methylobacter sp. BlB1]|uniref:TolC family protein n=1 Tax=Methylobacter sp. BlB1 TaxID=2785914 RepID=UPI00189565DF|nr:TolC family protein [Methylobacter sp. BlB1]MBF6647324.1 TolC family protein [Methylobacter sp. BlB1]